MIAQTIKISIQNPCKEDWNKMLAEDKGKFCLSCEKTVIDFSKMSATEVVNYLSNNATNICGRFSKYQLNVPLSNYTPLKSNFFNKYIAGVLMALGLYAPTAAQTIDANIAPKEQALKPKHIKTDNTPKKTIQGKILDKETGKPLVFAHIRLAGSNVSVNSDKNGFYTITIPTDFKDKNIQLIVSHTQHESVTITHFNFRNGIAKYDVKMQQEIELLKGDVMIMGGMQAEPINVK